MNHKPGSLEESAQRVLLGEAAGTVYVLELVHEYEPGSLVGVFSSDEEARTKGEQFIRDNWQSSGTYEFLMTEVQIGIPRDDVFSSKGQSEFTIEL